MQTSNGIGSLSNSLQEKYKLTSKSLSFQLKYLLLLDTDLLNTGMKRTSRQQLKWTAYRALVMALHWLSIFRLIFAVSTDNGHYLDSVGEFYRFFGGNRLYWTWCGIFYSFFGCFMTAFSTIYQRKNKRLVQRFMFPLLVISGETDHQRIGLNGRSLAAFRKKAAICTAIVTGLSRGLVGFFSVYLPYLYVVHLDVGTYWPQLCFWQIVNVFWLYFEFGCFATSLSYFYLLCFIVRSRFEQVYEDIGAELKRPEEDFHSRRVKYILLEYNCICVALHEYNDYWKYYLLCLHSVIMPMATMLTFLLLFMDIKLLLRIALVGVFIELFGIFSFTCLSAAHVNREAASSRVPMNRLLLKQRVAFIERQKARKMLDRFEGEPIGFSCINLFVVTKMAFLKVVTEMVFYVLLIIINTEYNN